MRVRGIDRPAELARRMNITDANLSKWLNGKAQPSKQSLRKMSEALNVPLLALELQAGLTEPDEVEIQPNDQAWPHQMEQAMDTYLRAVHDRPDLVPGFLERISDAIDWYDVKIRRRRTR